MSIQDLKDVKNLPGYAEFLEFLKEEKVAESDPHSSLIHYLIEVLKWLFWLENWYINTDMGIFKSGLPGVAPDVALFKGLVLTEAERSNLKSWLMHQEKRPPPTVVFEIASESTWPQDVEPDKKPLRYKQIGVREYFSYDPHNPQVWADRSRRLRGWRFSNEQRGVTSQEIEPDARGWLWSEELNSWLAADGPSLRLIDAQGQTRLTEAEAERAARQRAEQEAMRATLQTAQTEQKLTHAEQELIRAAQEAKQARQSEAKLRAWLIEKGFDPDNLK